MLGLDVGSFDAGAYHEAERISLMRSPAGNAGIKAARQAQWKEVRRFS